MQANRSSLLAVALAPVIPQIIGTFFNVNYNRLVVIPLLASEPSLERTFWRTCWLHNAIVYPIAIWMWLHCVTSLQPALDQLARRQSPEGEAVAWGRRRLINLPWLGAAICGFAWLICIPDFLLPLWFKDRLFDSRIWYQLPISFLVSAFIAITHSFFLIELVSHKTLFSVFFRETRADNLPGALGVSIRVRCVIWAISAGVCPIGSLLLLVFAPTAPGADAQWLALFVGTVGIAFGLCTAVMLIRLLAEPIDQLRKAAASVAQGELEMQVELRRADEFGLLIHEFNHMIRELREKERLRKSFGLHVGRKAAEHILARDPGLSGVEEEITVMFADIRSFTRRSSGQPPAKIVEMLNIFMEVMVRVVEEEHGGMINKFLGDGFMAFFGVGRGANHAQAAANAARGMMQALHRLNAAGLAGWEPIAIGIGIDSGRVIVGSIGSPERLEYTAIGSTVNLASRIEALTKPLGACVLISKATFRCLSDNLGFVELPPQRIRGMEEPVILYSWEGQGSRTTVEDPSLSKRNS